MSESCLAVLGRPALILELAAEAYLVSELVVGGSEVEFGAELQKLRAYLNKKGEKV